MAVEANKTYLCDSESYQHSVDVPPKYRALAGSKCPAYDRGSPCKGRLWRVGDGSRKENAEAKAKLEELRAKAERMRSAVTA